MIFVRPETITSSNMVNDIPEPDTGEVVWSDRGERALDPISPDYINDIYGCIKSNNSGDLQQWVMCQYTPDELTGTSVFTFDSDFNPMTGGQVFFINSYDLYVRGLTTTTGIIYTLGEDDTTPGIFKVVKYDTSTQSLISSTLLATGVNYSGLTFDYRGMIVTVNRNGYDSTIEVHRVTGALFQTIPITGYNPVAEPVFFDIEYVADGVDSIGGYYITDISNNSIVKLDFEFNFVVAVTAINPTGAKYNENEVYPPIGVTSNNGLIQVTTQPNVQPNQQLVKYRYDLDRFDLWTQGEEAIDLVSHNKYVCAFTNNTNPTIGVTQEPPSWVLSGKSNKYSMFDGVVAQPSIQDDSIALTFTMGKVINSVVGFNISADTVNVTMNDPIEGEVYNVDVDLQDHTVVGNNFYNYFFAPLAKKNTFSLFDLPAYPNATITVTFTATGGTVTVGELIVGAQTSLGKALLGSGVNLVNRDVTDEDEFGNIKITSRRKSSDANYLISVATSRYPYVIDQLKQAMGVPLVWSAQEGGDGLTVYGFYKDSSIIYEEQTASKYSIQVRGLV